MELLTQNAKRILENARREDRLHYTEYVQLWDILDQTEVYVEPWERLESLVDEGFEILMKFDPQQCTYFVRIFKQRADDPEFDVLDDQESAKELSDAISNIWSTYGLAKEGERWWED